MTVRWEDGDPGDISGVDDALRGLPYELRTGVTIPGETSFETLQLYAATTLPGCCRLSAPHGSQIVTRRNAAAAVISEGTLAYLTHTKVHDAPAPRDQRYEFLVHAYGPAAQDLAHQFATTVQNWDSLVREAGYPPLTVHPSSTPDGALPPGTVLDKPSARLVFAWPQVDATAEPHTLAAASNVSG